LHNRGVNIRYLGRLAKMARTEEGRDAELESRNLQRPYPLPKYWLEMLETEMIARVSKYVLGARLQKDEAPAAQTIAAFLNSLLGGSDGEEAPVLANGAAHGKAPAKVTQWKKGSKKAKRAGFSAMLSALTSSECPEVTVDSPVDATAWAHIVQACRSRFCYEFVLLGPSASAEHRQPLCKTAVLRRVCQQCGIHLASKNFNFLLRRPFCIRDVVNVQPLTKSSTPLVPCEDAREALESAQAEIERGNIRGAFLAAQRASSMMQQVCGAFHGDLARSLDTVANVLLQAEDTEAAIAMMYKSLAVNMQSTGLDTHHTVELHEKLGMVLHASGQTDIGLKHMHAALYIRSISCGPGHAGVLEAYQRIATMYQEIQHYSMAVKYVH
jgi:protein TIF31